LLTIGLFIQLQSMLVINADSMNAESFSHQRNLLIRIFPAWGAFALFLRLEPHFRELGLFPGFGWVALAFSALAIFTGLIQTSWVLVFSIWLASGFSLVLAILAFSGPMAAFGMLIGLTLGTIIIFGTAKGLQGSSRLKMARANGRSLGLKILAVIGLAAATGAVGFVSAQSGIHWVLTVFDQKMGMVGIVLFIVFLYVLLGWKLVWTVCRMKGKFSPSWNSFITPVIGTVLSLGVLWTGNLTGGDFLNNRDKLLISLFGRFSSHGTSEVSSDPNYMAALSLYWSVLFLAMAVAYWLSGRKDDKWEKLGNRFPKIGYFVASGYGVNIVIDKTLRGIEGFGKGLEQVIDQKVWQTWMPASLFYGITKLSGLLSHADRGMSRSLNAVTRVLVEVPAKFLQLVQTGDLRWYLVFSLGSGFAVLVHFLYFMNR
jgi:hypothetical protein